jgi:transcription-repair coupling factor (superfamily II helicase)
VPNNVEEAITAIREELTDRYGPVPDEVENLLAVARFRAHALAAGVTEVALAGPNVRFAPVDLRESQQLRLQRLYPKTIVKGSVNTILVPRPTTGRIGGSPVVGPPLLDWARDLIEAVLVDSPRAAAPVGR